MVLHRRIKSGSEWWFSKICGTGLDRIQFFADQDWTRTEKFHSPLICAVMYSKPPFVLVCLWYGPWVRNTILLLLFLSSLRWTSLCVVAPHAARGDNVIVATEASIRENSGRWGCGTPVTRGERVPVWQLVEWAIEGSEAHEVLHDCNC